MASPERTLGTLRAKLARGGGIISKPYQPPAIGDLVRRIDQALAAR
ncbi:MULTISPECIES: hypothetical protein [unclassified Sphingomonas]|nr:MULTISPECIES: hypothetical protein [unclassified Sphingomonas]